MNVLLHQAVSDITRTTGLAILDAIVQGQRNPVALAGLRHRRCKKSEAEIAKALREDWREEHLFTLKQSLQAWRFQQQLITECEVQIHQLTEALLYQYQLIPSCEYFEVKRMRSFRVRLQ